MCSQIFKHQETCQITKCGNSSSLAVHPCDDANVGQQKATVAGLDDKLGVQVSANDQDDRSRGVGQRAPRNCSSLVYWPTGKINSKAACDKLV